MHEKSEAQCPAFFILSESILRLRKAEAEKSPEESVIQTKKDYIHRSFLLGRCVSFRFK